MMKACPYSIPIPVCVLALSKTVHVIYIFYLLQQISDGSLHCIRVNEEGQLVAVGSHSGVTTILELSGGFTTPAKNEKATVGAMFERETHREKILETRAKELRVKEKQRAMAEAAATGAPTASTQGLRPVEGSTENAEKEGKTEVADGETAEKV